MKSSVLDHADLPPRHREVLREALVLFSQKGYAGASLRELARRVGVRQPSLYHYFGSKEELVEQILQYVGVDLLGREPFVIRGATLADVPAALANIVRYLYAHTDWPLFVRFVFAIALAEPRFAPRLRELFTVRAEQATDALMGPFVERGEIAGEDARSLVRMVVNAIALAELEARILYPDGEAAPDLQAFADFVTDVARAWLARRGQSS